MPDAKARIATLPTFTKWSYGLGAVANGVNSKMLGAFVLIFYNQVLGLSAQAVTVVMTVALMVDAVSAPLIGWASDNFRSRWGRRHPFMLASMIVYPVSFLLLWNPPGGLGEAQLVLWLAGWLILVRLFDTLFELPYVALLPELETDYDARTRLIALRFFVGILSATLITVLAYEVFMPEAADGSGGVDERTGWAAFSVACTGLVLMSIAQATLGTARCIPRMHTPPRRRLSLAAVFGEIFHLATSRSFVATAVFGGFVSMASGLYMTLNIYFLLYFWTLTQAQMALLSLGAVGAAIGSIFVAPRLGRAFGKRTAAIILAVGSALVCNIPILGRLVGVMPENGSFVLFCILWAQALVFPLCTAGYAILLTSMIADMSEEAERKTGRRSEGVLNSAEALFKKIISGGGALAAGWILAAVAFPLGAGRAGVPADVLRQMGQLYVPVSLVFSVLAIAALSLYRPDRRSHEDNLRWLAADSPPDRP